MESPSEVAALRRQVEALNQRVVELEGRRRTRARWLIAAVALVATGAFAQLTVFQPDTPAQASQVNGNFSQLQTWLEQKVGTAGSAAVTITGTATLNGATVINNTLRVDTADTTYDVWLQGGPGTSGLTRNLALLGYDDDSGDQLVVNFGNEYVNGTRVDGNLSVANRLLPSYDSGWLSVSSGNLYTWAHSLGVVPSRVELATCGAVSPTGVCTTRMVYGTNGFNDGNSCINPVNTTADATNVYVSLNGCSAWGWWTPAGGWQYTGDADGNPSTAFYRVTAWR